MEGSFFIITNDHEKSNLISYINDVCVRGKTIYAQVDQYRETRSQKQNRYLWGWVYRKLSDALSNSGQEIELENGGSMPWTPALLHEAFRNVFLSLPRVKTRRGTINMVKSTKDLSKEEFSEYIRNIETSSRNWWGINIPDPVGLYKNLIER